MHTDRSARYGFKSQSESTDKVDSANVALLVSKRGPVVSRVNTVPLSRGSDVVSDLWEVFIMIRHAFLLGLGVAIMASTAVAHSGRTNADGCHNDYIHGGYHCHSSGTPSSDGGGFLPAAGPEYDPSGLCGTGLFGLLSWAILLYAGLRFLPTCHVVSHLFCEGAVDNG